MKRPCDLKKNKYKHMKTTFILALLIAMGINSLRTNAQNNTPPQRPIIQTKYTADPAPMVYNDTVFLYVSHDEDDAIGFKMLD